MPRITTVLLPALILWAISGCASFPAKPDTPALLEWAGKANDNGNGNKDEDKGNDKGKGNDPEPKDKDKVKNSDSEPKDTANSDDDVIKTDRPTFTASSTTVGNHAQLETGYTFTRVGGGVNMQTFPEASLRFGLGADWIEGRIGQNLTALNSGGQSSPDNQLGVQDLLLGVKVALTKQKGILPEGALILQSTVPTGSPFLTQREPCPGIDYIFAWELLKDRLSMSGSFLANRALDSSQHFYIQLGQSLVLDYSVNKKLDAFAEWFALYPSGAVDPTTLPTQNFDSGLVYKLTNNCQIDVRVGVGLNQHANDFFTGSGISFRY